MSASARLVPADKKLPWMDAAFLICTHVPYVAKECVRLPNGRPARRMSHNPLYGMCYTTAEALWHLSEDPLVPMWVKYGPAKYQTHWYLTNPDEDNRVIDLTASQFSDWDLSTLYEYGRARPFGTTYPSKRARMLLDRIVPDIGNGLYSSHFHTRGFAGSHKEFLLARGKVVQRKAENSNPKEP